MSTENECELVSFIVGGQEYCIDIMSVREIRGFSQPTRLPHAPAFVRGVINLRGAVIPIVDLAERLGLDAAQEVARSVIIVVQIGGQLVGFLVSAVSDILTITGDKVQPTPDVASETAKEFVRGVIAMEDRMIRVLDTRTILPAMSKEAA